MCRTGGEPATDIEVEWQLDALDLRPVERWLAARTTAGGLEPVPGLRIVPEPAKRLVDVYVDTDDWRIGAAGYVLRVRRRVRACRDDAQEPVRAPRRACAGASR